MIPVPYVNPIGHIDQLTQEGFGFTIDNPESSGCLRSGSRVAALRYSMETGAVVKVQGTVTAVDHDRAKFSVTGPQADQETCSGKERRYTWNRLIDRDPGRPFSHHPDPLRRRTAPDREQGNPGLNAPGHPQMWYRKALKSPFPRNLA